MFQKILISLYAFFLPVSVFAQEAGSLQALLGSSNNIIDRLIVIIIFLAMIFFLWNMSIFILHAGDEQKRADGKQKMLWGIIALAVMIGIWGIIKIIQLAILGPISPIPPAL